MREPDRGFNQFRSKKKKKKGTNLYEVKECCEELPI
jgi:hypothetical protein